MLIGLTAETVVHVSVVSAIVDHHILLPLFLMVSGRHWERQLQHQLPQNSMLPFKPYRRPLPSRAIKDFAYIV